MDLSNLAIEQFSSGSVRQAQNHQNPGVNKAIGELLMFAHGSDVSLGAVRQTPPARSR